MGNLAPSNLLITFIIRPVHDEVSSIVHVRKKKTKTTKKGKKTIFKLAFCFYLELNHISKTSYNVLVKPLTAHFPFLVHKALTI